MSMMEAKMSLLYDPMTSKLLLAALCFDIIILVYEIGPYWRTMTRAQAASTLVYTTTTMAALAGNFLLGPIAGLAMSTCWLAFSIGQILFFGEVNGFAFKDCTSRSSSCDGDGEKVDSSHTKTELIASQDKLENAFFSGACY